MDNVSKRASVLLAIETSQRFGGVAVRDRTGMVLVEPLGHGERHSDDLVPAIDRLISRAGLGPLDIAAVAVSIGPGGFTGLRIGITTARMIAEVVGLGVIPVPTAVVVAEQIDGPGPILVALGSKRESCWVTRFHRGPDDTWTMSGTPGIRDARSIDLAGVRQLIGDEYLPAGIRARCEQAGVPISPPRVEPAACYTVAARMMAASPEVAVDPATVMPLYAREPEAVALWKAGNETR